nr:Chain A, micasin [Microsporum canis]
GFGCPFNENECHAHCLSIGRKFGFCAGPLRATCTCGKQ